MKINREDLAWAAGFLEGEGTFYCNIQKPKKEGWKAQAAISIRAVQVEKEPLERLANIFPFGKMYGPYMGKSNKQPHYQWAVHSFEGGQALIAAIWPWLSTKRKTQAKTAITKSLQVYNTRGTIHKIVRMSPCHPDRKHWAKGMCSVCYSVDYNKNRRSHDKSL